MSDNPNLESRMPEDPFPRTPTWYELNIKYGERPKGGWRASIAFFAPVLIAGSMLGVAELVDHGSHHNIAAETVYTDIPESALGKMVVDVTIFEGKSSQIEWSQLP